MPIIDMHFHTLSGPLGAKESFTGFLAPNTADELRRRNVAELARYHVVKAVASGDQLESYRSDLGERLIVGLSEERPSPQSLREAHRTGKLAVLAEWAPQYDGLGPDAPELEPIWAAAEELDIPVGIHMGLGPPGGRLYWFSKIQNAA
jgi:uncharacterized protein